MKIYIVYQDYCPIDICNGLDFDGQFFYFSWSENDRKIFFGFCRKYDLLEWYEKNIDIVYL
jgi:hypothetical protein